MSDAAFMSLSTVVNPPKKFTVDGVEYDLFSADNLSSEDEATVMALFARHTYLSRELELEKNVQKGAGHAANMKATRLQVIRKLTNLPKEVAEALPISAQIKLLEAIQTEVEDEDDTVPEEEEQPEPKASTTRKSSGGEDASSSS